jgi:FkbM family methyltransferase
MWFQHALPGATTIMVEPDPANLDVGRRNFALNGMTGTWIQAAVGFEHGGSVWLPCESDGRTRRVPTVSIAGLMEDQGLDRMDLVLCDTQGAELHVLETSRDALRQGRVRFLLVSTHHHMFSGDPLTHQRCLAFFQDLGAHVVAEHSVSESCSGDGLIAVSFDPADDDLVVEVSHVRSKNSLFGELEYDLARARGWRGPARTYGGRALGATLALMRRERG